MCQGWCRDTMLPKTLRQNPGAFVHCSVIAHRSQSELGPFSRSASRTMGCYSEQLNINTRVIDQNMTGHIKRSRTLGVQS